MTDTKATGSDWRWLLWLAVGLLIAANVVSLFFNFKLSINQSPLILPPSPGTDNAILLQQAIDDAERATETINTALSLLQGAGVIFALVAGVVTISGVWNSSRLNSGLQKVQANLLESTSTRDDAIKALQDLDTRKGEIQQFNDTLKAQVNDVQQSLQNDIAKALQDLDTRKGEIQSRLDELQQFENTLEAQINDVQQKFQNLEEFQNTLDDRVASIQKTSQALSLVQIGQYEIALGNYDTAIETLETARELDPYNRVVLYFLGDACLRDDRLDEGEKNLEKAIKKSDVQHDLVGSSLLQARASYAYLKRLRGDQAKKAGKAYREHYDYAVKAFRQLHAEDPKLRDVAGESVYGALAGLYRREGNIKEAIYWYEKCVEVTPQNTYPLNNLAQLYLEQGDKDKAMTKFKEIRERARRKVNANPDDYWLLFDYMTARIACSEGLNNTDLDTESVEVKRKLAFDLTDNLIIPLQKFRYGLETLRKLDPLPPNLETIIQQVAAEIERRQQ